MPARPRVPRAAAADHCRPVHFPNNDRAAVVLPLDVGAAFGVEIAGPLGVPVRPRIAETDTADVIGPVELSDGDFAAIVLLQEVE
jgi:hypothetical protein